MKRYHLSWKFGLLLLMIVNAVYFSFGAQYIKELAISSEKAKGALRSLRAADSSLESIDDLMGKEGSADKLNAELRTYDVAYNAFRSEYNESGCQGATATFTKGEIAYLTDEYNKHLDKRKRVFSENERQYDAVGASTSNGTISDRRTEANAKLSNLYGCVSGSIPKDLDRKDDSQTFSTFSMLQNLATIGILLIDGICAVFIIVRRLGKRPQDTTV